MALILILVGSNWNKRKLKTKKEPGKVEDLTGNEVVQIVCRKKLRSILLEENSDELWQLDQV